MMRTHALILLLLVPLALGGCDRVRNRPPAVSPLLSQSGTPSASAQKTTAAEEVNLHLKLVREMLDKRLYHAALAHLEALENHQKLPPAALFLRGDALRHLGRTKEATAIYRKLLDTSSAGLAYHGLGLIDASAGSMKDAVKNFRSAVALRPVDAKLRNDLGYALLLGGNIAEAHFQLTTAQELGGDDGRTSLNLLLLMYMEGDDRAAAGFAKQHNIAPATVAEIRMRAKILASQPAPSSAKEAPSKASVESALKSLVNGIGGGSDEASAQ